MVSMFEILKSVSILVDDVPYGVECLCHSIGLLEPRPQSYMQGLGTSAVLCRVHPKYAVAPTLLELISCQDNEEPGVPRYPLAEISALQGQRELKAHSTSIGLNADALSEVVSRLEKEEIAHEFFPPGNRDRIFLGGRPPHYDWSADAGLFVTLGGSRHLGLPEEAFAAPADTPEGLNGDAMVRILMRSYLVSDLGETLRVLDASLQWQPESVVDGRDARRAVMPFSMPRSAQIELVQPVGSGVAADAYDEIGPGAWSIRVGVIDVDAKAEDLKRRGTPIVRDGQIIRTQPAATLGVPFEFVAV
jgi:hypothetical protein